MRLIGPPSADPESVFRRLIAIGVHERFVQQMFRPLWDSAVALTIDPVGVIAQAHKETGGGAFTGQVKPGFYNTAGIKNRHTGLFPNVDDGDRPLAHARFPSWDVGALAHVQHLRAYAGWPVDGLIVDPRYYLVIGKHRCENWSDLGGKWAPSPTYGTEIETNMRRLQGAS